MYIFTKQGCIFGNIAEGKSDPKNDAFAYHFITLLPLNNFFSRSPLTLSPFTTAFHNPDYRQLLTMEYTPWFRAALSKRDSQILAPVSLPFMRAHWWRLYALLRACWQLLYAQLSVTVIFATAMNVGMVFYGHTIIAGNSQFYRRFYQHAKNLFARSCEVTGLAILVNNSVAPHSMPISPPSL